MKRVTIYAGGSTKEQKIDMQIIDLRAYAKAQGLNIKEKYINYVSGNRNDRENYQKLFNDVRKRKTDVVLVWKFDRFVRSTKELISSLEEFNNLGCGFYFI